MSLRLVADETPRLLTVAEVAERLRVCRRTVQELVRRRVLPSVRVSPRGVRVFEVELAAYVDRRREGGGR